MAPSLKKPKTRGRKLLTPSDEAFLIQAFIEQKIASREDLRVYSSHLGATIAAVTKWWNDQTENIEKQKFYYRKFKSENQRCLNMIKNNFVKTTPFHLRGHVRPDLEDAEPSRDGSCSPTLPGDSSTSENPRHQNSGDLLQPDTEQDWIQNHFPKRNLDQSKLQQGRSPDLDAPVIKQEELDTDAQLLQGHLVNSELKKNDLGKDALVGNSGDREESSDLTEESIATLKIEIEDLFKLEDFEVEDTW